MKNDLNDQSNNKNQQILHSLTLFVFKYSPATLETANTFYTTAEICKAVEENTGNYLTKNDVYEMMTNMQYTYDALMDWNLSGC